MNAVKERILIDISDSLRKYPWNEHRDLASFCVCSEYFMDCDDENNDIESDFNELIVVVDKDWLYTYILKMGIEDPLDYLVNEYTSDDSIEWFDEAARTGHLAMISFN